MALLHHAEIAPSKLDLLRAWAPNQPWWPGTAAITDLAGAYRFDDPAGEVGLETLLVRTDTGSVIQVPVTYRGAPLSGAEDALVGTMQHSVLGARWVYDGCADPVFVEALATTIRTGGTQAELQLQSADGLTLREATTRVRGSGLGAHDEPLDVVVRRVIDDEPEAGVATLTGTWPGQAEPAVLAVARPAG